MVNRIAQQHILAQGWYNYSAIKPSQRIISIHNMNSSMFNLLKKIGFTIRLQDIYSFGFLVDTCIIIVLLKDLVSMGQSLYCGSLGFNSKVIIPGIVPTACIKSRY